LNVVTDLFNYGMPIIRYDTGDIAVMEDTSSCNWGTKVFSKVLGRKVDFIYSTDDNVISPHVITNTMWKYPGVQQFQFIQKKKLDYVLKLNASTLPDNIENDIVKDFRSYLGDDARITFEYVDEIPVLNSGKRKKIVNEYHIR
jgi:phenylacetate-CoA ligase